MNARATAKFLRVPPRKARRVVDVIRGKRVDRALDLLRFTPLSAAKAIEKILRSAVANAENNFSMKPESLVIEQVKVDNDAYTRIIYC
jgi:large subunit ribosomal protein L22